MASYMTTTNLINSIKRRASIPEAQATFEEQDFIDFLNEEMDLGLVPLLLQTHEEHLLAVQDTTLVQGVNEYRIPERSIGGKLRDLSWVDNNDNQYEMTRISLENVYDVEYNNTLNHRYEKFYIRGNKVVMYPDVNSVGGEKIRFTYFRRPNELVSSTRTATVVGIDRNSGDITLDKIPDNFSSSIVYDFVQAKSPHEIYDIDKSSVSIDTTNKKINFAPADIPDDLVVGDFVMQAGETFVPNIPTELHVLLAHKAAARCLEAIGDVQGLDIANQKLQEMEARALGMIEDRVVGAPLKVVNKSGFIRKNFRR